MSQRISFRVRGEVQGVFFRKFTQDKARGYGVTGFIKNMSDGTVSGEAQGEQGSLDRLLADMRKGPTHARVSGVESDSIEAKSGESGFDTR